MNVVFSLAPAGGNQFSCSTCARKVDARKGLRFATLPPVLCVTLKVGGWRGACGLSNRAN